MPRGALHAKVRVVRGVLVSSGIRRDRIVKETDRATLIAVGDEEVWLPESQIAAIDAAGEVWIPLWLAEKKGLEYE